MKSRYSSYSVTRDLDRSFSPRRLHATAQYRRTLSNQTQYSRFVYRQGHDMLRHGSCNPPGPRQRTPCSRRDYYQTAGGGRFPCFPPNSLRMSAPLWGMARQAGLAIKEEFPCNISQLLRGSIAYIMLKVRRGIDIHSATMICTGHVSRMQYPTSATLLEGESEYAVANDLAAKLEIWSASLPRTSTYPSST